MDGHDPVQAREKPGRHRGVYFDVLTIAQTSTPAKNGDPSKLAGANSSGNRHHRRSSSELARRTRAEISQTSCVNEV
jgi:hypothetical protein